MKLPKKEFQNIGFRRDYKEKNIYFSSSNIKFHVGEINDLLNDLVMLYIVKRPKSY